MYNYCIVHVLYIIVLYCIVLYCIVLYCILLYCIVLYCIVLYCIIGDLDMVVVGAGTGGTVAGIGRKLKDKLPHVKVTLELS